MTFDTRGGRTASQTLSLDLTLINSRGGRTLIG